MKKKKWKNSWEKFEKDFENSWKKFKKKFEMSLKIFEPIQKHVCKEPSHPTSSLSIFIQLWKKKHFGRTKLKSIASFPCFPVLACDVMFSGKAKYEIDRKIIFYAFLCWKMKVPGCKNLESKLKRNLDLLYWKEHFLGGQIWSLAYVTVYLSALFIYVGTLQPKGCSNGDPFLVANKRLYKRLCPSVRPWVRRSVTRFGIQAKKWSNFHQCPCLTFATDTVVYTNLLDLPNTVESHSNGYQGTNHSYLL